MTPGPQLRCQTCGKRFTRNQGTSRLNCYECRPDRSKSTNLRYFPQNGESGGNTAENGENPENNGPLTRKSLKQLEEWGVEDTWQAEAVLTLARQIDSGKGGGSAGVAGAVKAHREAMGVAQAVSEVEEADVVTAIFAENA